MGRLARDRESSAGGKLMSETLLDVINRIKTGTPFTVTKKHMLAGWLKELLNENKTTNIERYREKFRLVLVRYRDSLLIEENKAQAIGRALNDLKILFEEAQNEDKDKK